MNVFGDNSKAQILARGKLLLPTMLASPVRLVHLRNPSQQKSEHINMYSSSGVKLVKMKLSSVQGMVDEEMDVKQFCTRHVEVMGTESDHVHIVALSDALQARQRKR